MYYFPLILIILCIMVNINGQHSVHSRNDGMRPLLNAHCSTVKQPTTVLKTENYHGKYHKTEINKNSAKSMCSCRDTLVELVPSSTNTLYVPSKVMVKRCDGSAFGKNTCMSTNTTKKEFTVLGMDVLNRSVMNAVVVELEEHTKCKVNCMVNQDDCNVKQKFMPDTCMCVCHDIAPCSKEMTWDPISCTCVCRGKKYMCSTGQEWDLNLCRCEKKQLASGESYNLIDENEEDGN